VHFASIIFQWEWNMQGQDADKPAGEDFSKSLKELEEESTELKSRIERERRAHNMPLDSQLGNPSWEDKAADGRFDRPKDDE
jgi:hypothetical protein